MPRQKMMEQQAKHMLRLKNASTHAAAATQAIQTPLCSAFDGPAYACH